MKIEILSICKQHMDSVVTYGGAILNKNNEVIHWCRDEVLALIQDNWDNCRFFIDLDGDLFMEKIN